MSFHFFINLSKVLEKTIKRFLELQMKIGSILRSTLARSFMSVLKEFCFLLSVSNFSEKLALTGSII